MAKQTLSCAILLIALMTAPVRAQTDQPSPAQQPLPNVGGVQTAPLEQAIGTLPCRMDLVRLWVDIPPWERAGHWIFSLFPREEPPAADLAARRSCLQTLDDPLVRFDNDLPPSPPPTW